MALIGDNSTGFFEDHALLSRLISDAFPALLVFRQHNLFNDVIEREQKL